MGASSQYASVPQSDEVMGLDQRSDKLRARDFGADAALLGEEEEGGFENSGFSSARRRRNGDRLSWYTLVKRALFLALLVTLILALGFCAGTKHQRMKGGSGSGSSMSSHEQEQLSEGASGKAGGLLPPQSLVPDSMWLLTDGCCGYELRLWKPS